MARDPFADFVTSLFGSFAEGPGSGLSEAGGDGKATAGEGNGSSGKADVLRRKAARRKVAELRQQVVHRLESRLVDLDRIDRDIGKAGQSELDHAERQLDGSSAPVRTCTPPERAMDAFTLDRVRKGIGSSIASARLSLDREADRLLGLGEDRCRSEKDWFWRTVATLGIELGRLRAGEHLPPEQECTEVYDQLKRKAKVDLELWQNHVAAAKRARMLQLEAIEAKLIARALRDFDLAARADPENVISLGSVCIRHSRRALGLFRPFPPTPALLNRRSHFGGLPDLPDGYDWPRHDRLGPLHFLAQIDLREFTHDIAELPCEGTLLFFASLSNSPIKAAPAILFDPGSTGRPVAAPDFGVPISGSEALRCLPGDGGYSETLLPYWPIGAGLIDTLPAASALDPDACEKPEYAGYCRAYDIFRETQFALAVAPMNADSRIWGYDRTRWAPRLFEAHITGYPWTWRGLGYVAEGLARFFAGSSECREEAKRWIGESRSREPDTPLPDELRGPFLELVGKARVEEDRIYRMSERSVPNGMSQTNGRAIERLLLDSAADARVAASLPGELLAALADSHVACPAGQMFGHLSSKFPVPNPDAHELCLLQLFRHPLFPIGADELRFLIPREALVRGAWNETRLSIPSALQPPPLKEGDPRD